MSRPFPRTDWTRVVPSSCRCSIKEGLEVPPPTTRAAAAAPALRASRAVDSRGRAAAAAARQVLNVKDGGVCWDTLRQVLSREPAHRMGAEAALRRVREARQV